MVLSSEDLLAGASVRHEVTLPRELVDRTSGDGADPAKVCLKPLTVRDLQQISKAAKQDDGLSASLMIQQALIEPELKLDQIQQLPAGLARFLVDQINVVSGIDVPQNDLQEIVQQPLARACFVLAKEFGWTPEEVSGMTIGQVLLFVEMSQQERSSA